MQEAPDVYVSDHYVQDAAYHVVRSGGSRQWLILFTTDGCGAYAEGQETRYCEKGDVVILPAGVPHDYRTHGERWAFHWAHFVPCEEWFAKVKLPLSADGIYAVHIRRPDRYGKMVRAFQCIHENQYAGSEYRQALALNVMEHIFILIAQEWEDRRENKPMDPRIAAVMQYLSVRTDQPLRVEDVARHVALSPSRLSHLFKQETGRSIMDTFNKMRLRHAANLLRYTSHSVEQIAALTGFSSVYYFSAAFKKYTGMSPTAYRTR